MVCDNGLCMLTYCRHGRHGAYIVISVNAPESGYSKISFRRSKIPLFLCASVNCYTATCWHGKEHQYAFFWH
ncbi:unknown [Prevotella sp. CAG:255]|nr:unknown [Prevotella sp. CAG:255]